jgi:hypothetical protein
MSKGSISKKENPTPEKGIRNNEEEEEEEGSMEGGEYLDKSTNYLLLKKGL